MVLGLSTLRELEKKYILICDVLSSFLRNIFWAVTQVRLRSYLPMNPEDHDMTS